MPSRLGILDPIRAPGGGSTAGIGIEISNIRRQAPSAGLFSRAVVIECLNDPSILTDEEVELYGAELPGGPTSIKRAPRNSLIARIYSGAGSSVQVGSVLCYPFFSPHLSVPVKPGEHVWVMNDSPEGQSSNLYWFSRVVEPDYVDDVNFTHHERKFDLYVDKITSGGTLAAATGDDTGDDETRTFDGLKEPEKVPGPPAFSDGPIDDDDADPTIVLGSGPERVNAYDLIDSQAVSGRFLRKEVVPRYTKRPGDLVLQGSNNSLICLGQDRGWTGSERPDTSSSSNAATQPSPYSGVVDIVAGRGRFFENSQPNPDSSTIPDSQPRVILNTRGYLEVDKNSAAYTKDEARSSIPWNRLDRPQEGDPDFLTDASRVYISMNSSADEDFGISPEFISPTYVAEPSPQTGPFIVIKSDEIRIIARKEIDREEINGSIRLIKEGKVGEDFASIYMMPDGVVQITGSRVFIGQPDQGSGPGEKKSEPYVKYSELEALLKKLFDNISDFCQTVLTHTTPGYGSPSIQINQAASSLQSETATRKSEIEKLKSSRIFGE